MSEFKVVPVEPTAEMVEAAEDAYMPFGDMDLAIRMALLTAPDVRGEPVAVLYADGTVLTKAECGDSFAVCCKVQTPLYTATQPAEQQPISHDWDGEGVPPIGTVCEYHWDDDDWRRCEIVGHYFGSAVAVDVVDASALRLPVDLLRPIKTPEQIAAEEQQPSAGDSLTSVPDELFAAEFAAWWEDHGQFCRAGGGAYEKSFAFEAWRHLYPQLMNLEMAAAEQQPAPDVSALVEALEWLRGAINCTPQNDKHRSSTWISSSHPRIKQVDELLAAHRKQGGGK